MNPSTGLDEIDVCDQDGTILVSGYLWSLIDDYMEIKGESFPLFDQGKSLKVVVRHKSGRTEIFSVYVYISQEKYMSLLIVCKTVTSNQRDYYRIKTNIKSVIQYEVTDNQAYPLAKPTDIRILDICIGGLLFGSKGEFEVGKNYKAEILLTDAMVELTFKILRKATSEKWGNEYGCMFLNVSRNSEYIICQYMFNKEREKRTNAKKSNLDI